MQSALRAPSQPREGARGRGGAEEEVRCSRSGFVKEADCALDSCLALALHLFLRRDGSGACPGFQVVSRVPREGRNVGCGLVLKLEPGSIFMQNCTSTIRWSLDVEK